MIDVKRFSGVMNLDDKPENVLAPQHIQATNLRFYGGQNGLTAQNVKGNYVIDNNELPSTGTNICIGSFYDQINQKIYFFNYNTEGNNGIYCLDVKTETVTTIFLSGTNSVGDVLNFSPDFPIHSVVMVYRPAEDGNLLYWVEGTHNRPRYLNVDTVTSLSPFTSDMLNAGKNAPLTPPIPIYQNDTTVNVNNLRKKLFRFSYRWVYKNGERSTFSPISKVPLPIDGYSPDVQASPTTNNYIRLEVYSGGADCQAIEIAGQQNIDNTWGDFFLITKLDLDQYNIADNSAAIYNFYNDGAYVAIDPVETDLYFSWLPDYANTLELLNGNVLIYGGLTDGYDPLKRDQVDVIVTSGLGNANTPSISFSYSGPNQFTLVVGSTVTVGATYTVSFDYVSGTSGDASPKNVTYTTIVGDDAESIATGIGALLNGNNISIDNLGNGVIRVYTSTNSGTITNVAVNTSVSGSQTASAAWKWSCPERLGLVYFDNRGKTNGVVSFVSDSALDTTDFAVTTPDFNTASSGTILQVPFLSATINHTPPDWATCYQWVRADLKPTNFLYWITNDYQDPSDGYLYFGIQNLTTQQTKNTGFVPSYEFTPGDRIRVVSAYSAGVFTPYASQLDFEIVGTEELTMQAPNDTTKKGTYIKVQKPTGSFPTYTAPQILIELYTPKARVSENSELFYEWGQKYDIYTLEGARYHKGQTGNQTASQPATFQWFDGDVYLLERGFYPYNNSTSVTNEYFEAPNYNDYWISSVNSNGRAWVIDENAQTYYNPTISRWGGNYQQGTTINNLNIFKAINYDEIDRSKGSIQRFVVEDRVLYVYQQRAVGVYGIYAKFIQDNSGSDVLTTTDKIITDNNIKYLEGQYGLGDQPTSLVRGKNVHYFVDPVRGYQVRRAGNGLTPISEIFKGQFYIRDLLVKYNNNYRLPDFTKSKILGTYNFFDEEYVCALQGGSLYGEDPLKFVKNQVITNGDINSPSTFSIVFAGNYGSPFTYITSFTGTPTEGDVVHLILKNSVYPAFDYPYCVQAGDTIADVINYFVTGITGSGFFTAVSTTFGGNPAISITTGVGTGVVSGQSSIEFPAYLATFTGTPSVGDIVTISVSPNPPSPPLPYFNYSYTVQAGDTISDIITALVNEINLSEEFTATAVTYEGFSGFTVRKLSSIYIYGSGTIELVPVVGSEINPYTFSFNELRNGYVSFFDYHPEWLQSAEDMIYTFKNGNIYKHNNTTEYCNFYGNQYGANITLVFNQNYHTKKSWNSIAEVASTVWSVPAIQTNTYSFKKVTQFTDLKEGEFELLESMPSASIKRDKNSSGGKTNGDFMKGNYLITKLEKENANNLITLSEVSCRFTDSPLNVK
jgi:hypothetical protein